jgi:hypothetical protein
METILPGWSRSVLAALCMWGIASVQAAVVMLPEARYQADLNFPLPAEHLPAVGSISIDRRLVTGTGVDRGHVRATAGTTDGLTPTAAISVELSGTGHGANSADAVASLIYYWKVEQVAGPPRSTAQVRIHVEGEVSSALAGDAEASVYAEAVIFFIGSHASFVAGMKPGVPFTGNSFDRTFTRQVSTQSEFWTTLFARGTARVSADDAPGTARMDAFADPLIEIDPAWEHASDFRVVFSSGGDGLR